MVKRSVQVPDRSGRPLSAPRKGAIVCASAGCRLSNYPELRLSLESCAPLLASMSARSLPVIPVCPLTQ
jgi:hypothetical protein